MIEPNDVRSLTQAELWHLADEPHLTVDVCEVIMEVGEEAVLVSLACNYDTPETVLSRLAARGDRVASLARENPNAAARDKELAPIGNFGASGIARFAEQKNATRQQARALADAYDLSPHPGGPILGEVWRRIATCS
ncbi:hypothetical protein [Microbacterium sp. BH-3-3-3]|uniref:hypothetical protein n=1 Tax=Microbacterium sp. BH-3-3-3 TaxID=1906742 RepID=UPI0011AAF215|nr:hypothetical protein [Microbacterium sp. BH-3-3-3]